MAPVKHIRNDQFLYVIENFVERLGCFRRLSWKGALDRAGFLIWSNANFANVLAIICHPISEFVQLAPENVRWHVAQSFMSILHTKLRGTPARFTSHSTADAIIINHYGYSLPNLHRALF